MTENSAEYILDHEQKRDVYSSLNSLYNSIRDIFGVFDLRMKVNNAPTIISLLLSDKHSDEHQERKPIVLSTFLLRGLALDLQSRFPDVTFLELANIERLIVGDSRHAMNLGDQLASEVFASVLAISNIDIYLLGASNVFISDRKGINDRYTDIFWNSFISSLMNRLDGNRLFIYNTGGVRYVEELIRGYCRASIQADVIHGNVDFQVIAL